MTSPFTVSTIRPMTLKENFGCKKLELQTGNKLLSWVYHAGVKRQEVLRASLQDVDTICISAVCHEVMRYTSEPNNTKKKRLSIAFSELCYIWSGILFVFQKQVAVLYDDTLRLAHFTMEYVKRKAAIDVWEEPTRASLLKKNRARKNNIPIDHLPKKRVKFANVEFVWQLPNDSEADDESTIQILRKSKVMNRDQISIREVISEPLPDVLSQYDDFEAAENGSTQTFLRIRELVVQGRSIAHTIQSESVSHMFTGDCELYEGDDYYPPMTSRHSSPLPQTPLRDIERCYEELDVDIPGQDENVEMNIERHGSAFSHISLPSLPSKLSPPKRAKKGKNRRRFQDEVIQISVEFNAKTDSKLMRCADARSDCVTKDHIMRQLKLINFHKPAHALRSLLPRSVKETVSMMVGLKRVQKAKRKEPDDLNMVQDFFNSYGNNRRGDDVQLEDMQLEDLRRQDQPRQNRVNRSTKRKRSSSNCNMINEDVQPCNERFAQANELDFGYQDDESTDVPHEAEPIWEPERFCDPEPVAEPEQTYENITEPEHEPNLPTVNLSRIVERQGKSATGSNVPKMHNFQLESDLMPHSVLRLLIQFVTVSATTNGLCQTESQALSMLNNQKNREKWGLKGVLQNLFRLWHINVYPLGMVELLQPEKKKVAAALAFYSIMELNSPRVGLIEIEKVENSNTIYNIAMSEKLINLLQKGHGK